MVWQGSTGGRRAGTGSCSGPPRPDLRRPADEDAPLSINYTSGTTGRPKGVMTTHRGAYLHSLGVIAEAGLTARRVPVDAAHVPLQRLGLHVGGNGCGWPPRLPGAVDPAAVWRPFAHSGSPTVRGAHGRHHDPESGAAPCPTPVALFIGGAPPSATLLERAAELNIEMTHLYGMTETYGPIAVCAWNPDWDEQPVRERAELRARQGVGTIVSCALRVVEPRGRTCPATARRSASWSCEATT